MLDSLYQSLAIFFVAEAAYADSDVDIWEFGTTIITSCLITMLVHGAIEIKSWVSLLLTTLFIKTFTFTISVFIILLPDNTACFINRCKFSIVLCLCVHLQCIVRQLFRFTIYILGYIPVHTVTHSLAYNIPNCYYEHIAKVNYYHNNQ